MYLLKLCITGITVAFLLNEQSQKIGQLNDELKIKTAAKTKLVNELETTKKNMDSLQTTNQLASQKIIGLESTIKDLNKTVSDLQKQISELQKANTVTNTTRLKNTINSQSNLLIGRIKFVDA